MTTPKNPAGHFTVLYFAAATSYTKRDHDFFPAPLPVYSLFGHLEQKYPGITQKVLASCAVTVNLEYVDMQEETSQEMMGDGSVVLREGDEVGIIPPVSSG